jgi:DedD protein
VPETEVIPLPDKAPVEPEQAAPPAAAPVMRAPVAPAPPPAAKPVAGAPTAWVVQLGSFSNRENAFALRDKLRKRRYTAFVDDVAGAGNKPIYRVRVGPELLRSRADTLRDQLEKEFRLKGIVVTHEVS